jgi:hypothetical protein
VTPKSLAEIVGLKVSPRRDSDISTGNLRRSCLVPMSINFGVFWIVLATPFRYSRKIVLKRKYIALSTSCIINERRSLESSTYDSNRLVNDNCGISLIHIQNRYTIWGGISSLANQSGLPAQPGSYEQHKTRFPQSTNNY